MSTLRLVVAAVLAIVGLVWIGQGLGFIAGSAMTGSSFWAVMGVVLLAIAAGVLWFGRPSGAAVDAGSPDGADRDAAADADRRL